MGKRPCPDPYWGCAATRTPAATERRGSATTPPARLRCDELNERLAAVPNIHPNIAGVCRRNVERLAEALADPRDRDETRRRDPRADRAHRAHPRRKAQRVARRAPRRPRRHPRMDRKRQGGDRHSKIGNVGFGGSGARSVVAVLYRVGYNWPVIEVRQTDEYEKWFRKLRDREAKGRILIRVRRLSLGNPGDVRPVGGGISELRIDYGPGYRVYCLLVDRETPVLLFGGDKSTQPQDIEKARVLANELVEGGDR